MFEFEITQEWLFFKCLTNFDSGIAGTFARNIPRSKRGHKNKRYFVDQVQGYFVNGSSTEALWECSSKFLCEKSEDMVGRIYPNEEEAFKYLFASFRNWWYNFTRDDTWFKMIQKDGKLIKLNVKETTIKGDEMVEDNNNDWSILLGQLEEFAKAAGKDDYFFFTYLLLSDKEKKAYHSGSGNDMVVLVNGRKIKRQTFYNRLNTFKKKLAKVFNGE